MDNNYEFVLPADFQERADRLCYDVTKLMIDIVKVMYDGDFDNVSMPEVQVIVMTAMFKNQEQIIDRLLDEEEL